jgi:uncharacterized protein (TIGR03435 family)
MLRRLVYGIAFLTCMTFGQSFETLSITRNKSGGPSGELHNRPDGLSATNVTLRQLLVFAYHLNVSQLQGPGWIDADGFDIAAKVKDKPSGTELASRLQAVLTDRFQLKLHHETKDMPVYFLVVANGGPKLRNAKEGEDAFNALVKTGISPFKANFAAISKGCDLPAFAERLGRPLDHPVVDKTGIQGKYWFQLEWAIEPGSNSSNPSQSLLVALRDQLGLTLENQTAPQDVLVIDQAEKL